ncbi:uncharacterized protein LAESUDRAFT_667324 [Laetiporus sulphureus 93-53]|uniref:Uncharacterized protein n=1 Tax=Laetiporus sulphureus 93-53 TaxID=1314785 RepID=A0A165AZ74_9APHY|nr:uncharacterized protein LAESUDRAFT_667324 [Laetiporus sulphureus 93-53]KZS99931.1 hypothetical protein LAESUDRAFT_667324 [Laetiporus sulphureus 93-53]
MASITPTDGGVSSGTSHEIRITNHGKIRAWVEFALEFFQKNPDRPLTFHTLPAAKSKGADRQCAAQETGGDETEGQAEAATVAKKQQRMHTSMSTIPRLVSVVEIVKREYLKTLDPGLSEAGKLSGLHQYNEVGELEVDISAETSEEQRQMALAIALQGRRHLQQRKVAFMKVTLCRQQLPELVASGATYQQPQLRSLSKSAKARLNRRLKKGEQANEAA